MKISSEQAANSLRYLRETPNPPLRVESVSAEDAQRVMRAWDGNDEIRSAMVAELRDEVSTSSYEVPPDWVAEKLVGRLLSDRIR